ncbi:hypothetical protein PIB30_040748 [Stylosanthes scabra]|uniref:F-box domain-containing protein n=1 Tax=Stylosanthes scabra TaxID=79078 RepID=A0ABU6WEQ1_9FABA|nr:hypothetical protein [Stylosanthes scabra]
MGERASLKKKKRNKKKNEIHGKDENTCKNISDLPNVLIHEILSSLPTKDAVQTSVLSKYWRHQWRNVYKFELKEESHERREAFKDFVKSLVRGSKNSLCLKKFSLSCEVGNDAALVNVWLLAFINRGIEELILDFNNVKEQLYFPEDVFDSPTLRKFHLSMPFCFILPPRYDFQNLKEMTLKHVVFQDGYMTLKLFCGCFSLEDLTLIDCNWMNVGSACICCPMLKNLTIIEWIHEDAGDDNDDEEEEEDSGPQCQIVIVGTNLKTFSYEGDMANDYFFYCTSSVVKARLNIKAWGGSSWHTGFFVFKMLRAFPNVEKLSISDSAIQALCHAHHLIPHLPCFNNVTHLQLMMEEPLNLPCKAFMVLLHNSPCLQTLHFDMGISVGEEEDVGGGLSIPKCFGTHLKRINISGFSGKSLELNAIKYLLGVTPVLEELNIYSNGCVVDSDDPIQMMEDLSCKILAFPRASQDCDLHLE